MEVDGLLTRESPKSDTDDQFNSLQAENESLRLEKEELENRIAVLQVAEINLKREISDERLSAQETFNNMVTEKEDLVRTREIYSRGLQEEAFFRERFTSTVLSAVEKFEDEAKESESEPVKLTKKQKNLLVSIFHTDKYERMRRACERDNHRLFEGLTGITAKLNDLK